MVHVRCDVIVPFAPVVIPDRDVDSFVVGVVVVVVVDVFAYVVDKGWVVGVGWTIDGCDL